MYRRFNFNNCFLVQQKTVAQKNNGIRIRTKAH